MHTSLTGKPIVDSLTFHLDSVSTYPFQSGPPVFTLTCNFSGGPATTVRWKRGHREVYDDSSHVMTNSLVDQSGPDYTSTLKVRGRRAGVYSCAVRNSKGTSSARTLTVTGTWRMTLTYRSSMRGTLEAPLFILLVILFLFSVPRSPRNPTAVQVNATAVRVSWTAPSSWPTPSGYRIYYQAEGHQSFTTVDTGREDTEYLLTDLRPGTTYNIRMVTLSRYLPSEFQTLEPITLGEGIKTMQEYSMTMMYCTNMHITCVHFCL